MTCNNNTQWTLRFPYVVGMNGSFEITPSSVNLRQVRGKYDYAYVELEPDAGEMMKPQTDGGVLGYQQPVEILCGGEVLAVLSFRPNRVTYSQHTTTCELHDLHESLDSGLVDKHWDEISLRAAYEYVFSKRDTNQLTDLKFTIPDELPSGEPFKSTLVGGNALNKRYTQSQREFGLFSGMNLYQPKATERLIHKKYALDFDGISPAKAIWKLNNLFSVNSWVDEDQTLWVGYPEATATAHLAAPDDSRVWRYNPENVNITHPRSPIYAVVAKGDWIDKSGIGTADDVISWFDKSDEKGTGDVRAEGVAFATGVDPENGEKYQIHVKGAKKDALPDIARLAFHERVKRQNAGLVEIVPEHSGTDVSEVTDLRVGDVLRVVPDDRWFNTGGRITSTTGQMGDRPAGWDAHCGQYIYNEAYLVTGVTHSVEAGEWTVSVHVSMFPDMEIESFVRYFDPKSKEYQSEEDVFKDVNGVLPDWLGIESNSWQGPADTSDWSNVSGL